MKKNVLLAFLLLAGGLLLAGKVRAADREVLVFEGAFLPQAFSIDVGESVTWVWREGICPLSIRDEGGREIRQAVLDEENPLFTFFFDLPGNFTFVDAEDGATGSVLVVPFAVKVEVVDLAFTPEEVSIFEGDAINWVWIEGIHTITSGNGSADPEAGRLFDVESTDALRDFSYAFDAAGHYIYFCRPHEEMRMFGQVTVQRRFVRGDLGGDGELDISDAIQILGSLFLGLPARDCADSADSNDDGAVDVSDGIFVLEYLFLGGRTIPPPYPRPGPDRTDDNLECR